MKYFLIITIIVLLSSCNQQTDKTQTLQNQIDSLKTNAYKPGFGEFMSSIQVHHNKLWFAGQNENWKLADFEINEINENLDDIKKYCTDRPETKSLPMIDPALENIKKAIQQQNPALFKEEYTNLTNSCNSCHQATQHEFNVITIPITSPFSNQDFKINK